MCFPSKQLLRSTYEQVFDQAPHCGTVFLHVDLGKCLWMCKAAARISVSDHYSSSQHNGPFGNYTSCIFGLFLNDWEFVLLVGLVLVGLFCAAGRWVGKQWWGWRSLAVDFEVLWSVGQPLLSLQAALTFFCLEEFNSSW